MAPRRLTRNEPSRRKWVTADGRRSSPTAVHHPDAAVVLARDDDVSERGSATVAQLGLAVIDRTCHKQPLGPGGFVERADVPGRLGHEDAGAPVGTVGAPSHVRRVDLNRPGEFGDIGRAPRRRRIVGTNRSFACKSRSVTVPSPSGRTRSS